MVLQRPKICFSTLSSSLRLEVNSSFTNTKENNFQSNKFQQSHRSGVSILSRSSLCMTLLSPRLQRESSLRADKRDLWFSHCFHPLSAAWGSFHNIDRILETPQSISSSIIVIKRSNGKPCSMRVPPDEYYLCDKLIKYFWQVDYSK